MKNILKTLAVFLLGTATGIISFYGYYTHKYYGIYKLMKAVLEHEYHFLVPIVNFLKATFYTSLIVIIFIIAVIIIHKIWIHVIQKTNKKIEAEKEELKKSYQILKEEKEKLEEEKQRLYSETQEKIKQYKEQIREQAEKKIIKIKKNLEKQYQEDKLKFEKWKKQESYEKERLKEKIRCLENEINKIFIQRAKKFKSENPGRYKKEIKKAQKIIERCNDPNYWFLEKCMSLFRDF